MKKILGFLIIIIFLSGCTKENVDSLNLEQISTKLNQTKIGDQLLFNKNINVTEEFLTAVYQIDFTDIESFVVSIPFETDNTNMFAIFKPTSNSGKQEIYKFINNYKAELEEKGDNEQLEKLETKEHGEYIICIATIDNAATMNLITEG